MQAFGGLTVSSKLCPVHVDSFFLNQLFESNALTMEATNSVLKEDNVLIPEDYMWFVYTGKLPWRLPPGKSSLRGYYGFSLYKNTVFGISKQQYHRKEKESGLNLESRWVRYADPHLQVLLYNIGEMYFDDLFVFRGTTIRPVSKIVKPVPQDFSITVLPAGTYRPLEFTVGKDKEISSNRLPSAPAPKVITNLGQFEWRVYTSDMSVSRQAKNGTLIFEIGQNQVFGIKMNGTAGLKDSPSRPRFATLWVQGRTPPSLTISKDEYSLLLNNSSLSSKQLQGNVVVSEAPDDLTDNDTISPVQLNWNIQPNLPHLFIVKPKADFVVHPSEYITPSEASSGSYTFKAHNPAYIKLTVLSDINRSPANYALVEILAKDLTDDPAKSSKSEISSRFYLNKTDYDKLVSLDKDELKEDKPVSYARTLRNSVTIKVSQPNVKGDLSDKQTDVLHFGDIVIIKSRWYPDNVYDLYVLPKDYKSKPRHFMIGYSNRLLVDDNSNDVHGRNLAEIVPINLTKEQLVEFEPVSSFWHIPKKEAYLLSGTYDITTSSQHHVRAYKDDVIVVQPDFPVGNFTLYILPGFDSSSKPVAVNVIGTSDISKISAISKRVTDDNLANYSPINKDFVREYPIFKYISDMWDVDSAIKRSGSSLLAIPVLSEMSPEEKEAKRHDPVVGIYMEDGAIVDLSTAFWLEHTNETDFIKQIPVLKDELDDEERYKQLQEDERLEEVFLRRLEKDQLDAYIDIDLANSLESTQHQAITKEAHARHLQQQGIDTRIYDKYPLVKALAERVFAEYQEAIEQNRAPRLTGFRYLVDKGKAPPATQSQVEIEKITPRFKLNDTVITSDLALQARDQLWAYTVNKRFKDMDRVGILSHNKYITTFDVAFYSDNGLVRTVWATFTKGDNDNATGIEYFGIDSVLAIDPSSGAPVLQKKPIRDIGLDALTSNEISELLAANETARRYLGAKADEKEQQVLSVSTGTHQEYLSARTQMLATPYYKDSGVKVDKERSSFKEATLIGIQSALSVGNILKFSADMSNPNKIKSEVVGADSKRRYSYMTKDKAEAIIEAIEDTAYSTEHSKASKIATNEYYVLMSFVDRTSDKRRGQYILTSLTGVKQYEQAMQDDEVKEAWNKYRDDSDKDTLLALVDDSDKIPTVPTVRINVRDCEHLERVGATNRIKILPLYIDELVEISPLRSATVQDKTSINLNDGDGKKEVTAKDVNQNQIDAIERDIADIKDVVAELYEKSSALDAELDNIEVDDVEKLIAQRYKLDQGIADLRKRLGTAKDKKTEAQIMKAILRLKAEQNDLNSKLGGKVASLPDESSENLKELLLETPESESEVIAEEFDADFDKIFSQISDRIYREQRLIEIDINKKNLRIKELEAKLEILKDASSAAKDSSGNEEGFTTNKVFLNKELFDFIVAVAF